MKYCILKTHRTNPYHDWFCDSYIGAFRSLPGWSVAFCLPRRWVLACGNRVDFSVWYFQGKFKFLSSVKWSKSHVKIFAKTQMIHHKFLSCFAIPKFVASLHLENYCKANIVQFKFWFSLETVLGSPYNNVPSCFYFNDLSSIFWMDVWFKFEKNIFF